MSHESFLDISAGAYLLLFAPKNNGGRSQAEVDLLIDALLAFPPKNNGGS